MTAQYKPYKDQEDFDEDQLDENWADGQEGRVEIFDKSQAPRSKRKVICGSLIIAIVSVILGVLVGYFAHTRHSECKHTWAVALHSIMGANPTIREKILKEISADEIKEITRFACHNYSIVLL